MRTHPTTGQYKLHTGTDFCAAGINGKTVYAVKDGEVIYAAKHKAAGNGFGYGIAPLDGISRTISARYYKDGSEILIAQEGKNPRRLTPRECARLQGFPDSFKIPVSDTQAYKQFGNSVVVPLMAEIAKLVITKLQEMDGNM
jgi:DNA (cytosine-5)-methyltransferase 1